MHDVQGTVLSTAHMPLIGSSQKPHNIGHVFFQYDSSIVDVYMTRDLAQIMF